MKCFSKLNIRNIIILYKYHNPITIRLQLLTMFKIKHKC